MVYVQLFLLTFIAFVAEILLIGVPKSVNSHVKLFNQLKLYHIKIMITYKFMDGFLFRFVGP